MGFQPDLKILHGREESKLWEWLALMISNDCLAGFIVNSGQSGCVFKMLYVEDFAISGAFRYFTHQD
jgi:hypothetical protein